jgi:hypothetical protein
MPFAGLAAGAWSGRHRVRGVTDVDHMRTATVIFDVLQRQQPQE